VSPTRIVPEENNAGTHSQAAICNCRIWFRAVWKNERPLIIRAAFASFGMEEVSLLYSVAGGKGRPARELIISTVHQ
jgi:hypothetical protein